VVILGGGVIHEFEVKSNPEKSAIILLFILFIHDDGVDREGVECGSSADSLAGIVGEKGKSDNTRD
jgi:hypothetical protein